MNSYRPQTLNKTTARTIQATLLAGVLISHGCLSTKHRIERYLTANADRPAAVVQALRDGDRLVPGMRPQEVRLAMGAPSRTKTGTAPTTAVWYYDQSPRRDDSMRGSDMWTLPIPWLTVVFGAGDTVSEIIDYDDLEAPPMETKPEVIAIPKQESAVPPAPAAAAAVAIPAYRPTPDEINVLGWPEITLQGLTGGGSVRRAVINGEIHEPGDFIGDVRLDAVYANGVVIEYRGQRAFLRPGESTGGRDLGKL